MTTVTQLLQGSQKLINAEIIRQIREQGHSLTGKLEHSVSGVISGDTLYGEAKAYIRKLEYGVAPEDIKMNSEAFDEMTRYVELRMGYRGVKAQKVAYLILKKQMEEGNPTRGSYKFSKTGERKHLVTISFKNKAQELDRFVGKGIDDIINQEFHKQKSETF